MIKRLLKIVGGFLPALLVELPSERMEIQ